MSRSNGHEYITFGWIATIILALIAGSIYHSQYTSIQQSSEYADKCATKYREFISSINATTSGQKTSHGNQNNEGELDWCDLAAQHSMAESTRGLHWAAWATVGFTGFGAFLRWQTLIATQQTVKVTREIGQAQTRAYLGMDTASENLIKIDNPKIGNRVCVKFCLKNFGNSPAKNFRYAAMCKFQEHPINSSGIHTAIPKDDSGVSKANVHASGIMTCEAFTEEPLESGNAKILVGNGNKRLYLIARVDYTDVFDQDQFINICLYFESSIKDQGGHAYIGNWYQAEDYNYIS